MVLCPDKFLVLVTVLIAMNKQDENQFMREKIYSGYSLWRHKSIKVGRRGSRNSLWVWLWLWELAHHLSRSGNGE